MKYIHYLMELLKLFLLYKLEMKSIQKHSKYQEANAFLCGQDRRDAADLKARPGSSLTLTISPLPIKLIEFVAVNELRSNISIVRTIMYFITGQFYHLPLERFLSAITAAIFGKRPTSNDDIEETRQARLLDLHLAETIHCKGK